MISYHLSKDKSGKAFGSGFKTANVSEVGRLSKAITNFVWSPCVWRDGRRLQANFLRADWLVLDFDNDPGEGMTTLEEAKNLFCDMRHIIGTTRSHQKGKDGKPPVDRFRVLLNLERPCLNLKDYRYMMAKILRRYPGLDEKAKDGARFFFPCTEVVQAEEEGYSEDYLEAPEGFGKYTSKLLTHRGSQLMDGATKASLTEIIPEGMRNNTWFRTAAALCRMGLSFDEIVEQIVLSPTCRKDPSLEEEVRLAVRNGFKAAYLKE